MATVLAGFSNVIYEKLTLTYASTRMQNLLGFGFKPTIPITPP
jgi:hypothetical protein